MYQELVDKCKQAYKDKNIVLALHYWEEIFKITDEKLNKLETTDDKQRFEVWKEHQKYIEQFSNDEVYGITDYGKRKAYEKQAKEDIFRNKDKISLSDIAKEDLDILDDFCDMYAWLPVQNKDNTYNIVDTELNKMVEDEDYNTFNELVNRIVGRAIDYFRDEMEWDEDDEINEIKYGNELYNIALKYKKEDKWEEDWLETFKNELNKK